MAQVDTKLVMREDFEGDWAGRADSWDADSWIKFKLDTKVAHRGKASLRLTPQGMQDVCHGNSPKFPGAGGVLQAAKSSGSYLGHGMVPLKLG